MTEHSARAYARDRVTGRHGQLMPPLYPGSRVAFLRPVDGGLEWTTDVNNLIPCDAEGRELSVREPA